jgi:hypothetical protein
LALALRRVFDTGSRIDQSPLPWPI